MTDSQKIREYSRIGWTDHKQVIITGLRPNKKRFKIICDIKLAPLIQKINELGVHTLWSCQGDSHNIPYLTISSANLSLKKLDAVDSLIKSFWKKKFLYIRISNGQICYYAHTRATFLAELQDYQH